MAMLEHLMPSSPLATGLIALAFAAGNVLAMRRMRVSDDDDE